MFGPKKESPDLASNTPHSMKSFLLALITMGAAVLSAQDRAGVPSSPETNIVSKLEQIVSLRQQAVQQHASLVSANKTLYDSAFDLALAKAQLDLARERRSDVDCLKALNQIVALRKKALEYVTASYTAGNGDAHAVTEASVALLRAEIDAEREIQKQKAGTK